MLIELQPDHWIDALEVTEIFLLMPQEGEDGVGVAVVANDDFNEVRFCCDDAARAWIRQTVTVVNACKVALHPELRRHMPTVNEPAEEEAPVPIAGPDPSLN